MSAIAYTLTPNRSQRFAAVPIARRALVHLFDESLHRIIGGLHLPVPEGRMRLAGLDVQRVLASGEGLFSPLTMAEVERQLALLEAHERGVVGVGGHDSSDEVIALFDDALGDRYRRVRVGGPIRVEAASLARR